MRNRSLSCFCFSFVIILFIYTEFLEFRWHAFRRVHIHTPYKPINPSLNSKNTKDCCSISESSNGFEAKDNDLNLISSLKERTSRNFRLSQSAESSKLRANRISQQVLSRKSYSRKSSPELEPNPFHNDAATPRYSNTGSSLKNASPSTLTKKYNNVSFKNTKLRSDHIEKSTVKKDTISHFITDDEKRILEQNGKRDTIRVGQCREIRDSDKRQYSPQQEPSQEISKNLENLPRVNVLKSSFDVQTLADILEKRLEVINASTEKQHLRKKVWHRTCYDDLTLSNSCDEVQGCLKKQLPQDAINKIRQLTDPSHLKLQPTQLNLLKKMADKVDDKYDIIFISAASSNHYFESQALLQSLHTKVFPLFKNFTFLFYDLGFTSEQRAKIQKFCRCTVLDYDSSMFPKFALDLKKFAWKPYLIKAHAHQARVLVWMDASIRFYRNPVGLRRLLTEEIRTYGVKVGYSLRDSCFTTCRSTYHWFGDEPCAYLGLPIFQASILIFHNDPLVHRVILEPWTACAFDERCIAPPEADCASSGCSTAMKNYYNYHYSRGAFKYGLCHHYDQSVITLILHKLYVHYSPLLMIRRNETLIICRGDFYDYFSTL